MVLTNAERQKRWREKRKAENKEEYLKKERMRKRAAYVSVENLSEKEIKKRRKAGRERERKSYYRRKQERAQTDTIESSNRKSTKPKNKQHLIVKLPAVKKRYRRALQQAYRDINRLKEKNKDLEKGKRTLQRRCQRLVSAKADPADSSYSADVSSLSCEENFNQQTEADKTLTPRSKSNRDLLEEGLTPRRHSGIRKKIVMANSIIDAVSPLVKETKKKKHNGTQKILTGILKKYRCISYISKSVGVSRRKILNMNKQRTTKTLKNRLQAVVTDFLEREDNSTTLPGKKDIKTAQKEVKQRMVLSDYMHNLHEKFRIENPTVKISRSAFSKLRPQHIFLACFSSRKTCLCILHQNMALKLKSIRKYGISCSQNLDVFIKQFSTNQDMTTILRDKLDKEVIFKEMKKVNDGEKYRWRETEEKMSKDDFIELMNDKTSAFREHFERVQTQYREIRRLRENLQEGEILLWMDFAENYTCFY